MQWTNENTLEVIELYKSKKLLWDPSDRNYRDKTARRDAYEEISKQVGFSVEEIEKKIHSLRTQFQREFKRTAKTSSWFAFEQMKFLLFKTSNQINFKREPISPLEKRERSQTIDREELYSSNQEINVNYEIDSDIVQNQTKKICLDITKAPFVRPSNINCSEIILESSTTNSQIISPISESSTSVQKIQQPTIDHLETFGKYVTEELRNIRNDPYSIQMAKHRINQILFDATTGAFKIYK